MAEDLTKFLEDVARTEVDKLKPLYGSNFRYDLDRFTQEENGLSLYGVHYSENENFAIFPQTGYYPKGVYFYFLSNTCEAGKGTGFATDRKWANIGKINNDRMLIIKSGHPRNFSEADYKKAVSKLKRIVRKLPEPTIKPGEHREQSVPAVQLFNLLHAIEASGKGLTNKMLHSLGYDGVVDYDGALLPVESCQGVMTWPGSFSFVHAIPTPTASNNPGYNPMKRIARMQTGLKAMKPGTLKLSFDELESWKMMKPKTSGNPYAFGDLLQYLLTALDFRSGDAWKWVEWHEYGERNYDSLEQNPTTPKEFWERNIYATDPGLRMAARDHTGFNK